MDKFYHFGMQNTFCVLLHFNFQCVCTSVTTIIAFGFECNESAWLAHDMYRFLKCYRDDYRWCYEPDLDIATEGQLSAVGAFLFLGKSNKKVAFPI